MPKRKSNDELVTAYPEERSSGSIVFTDHVPFDNVDEPDPVFHRMELTEGEQAVLWDILQYVHERFRELTAAPRGPARCDFRTLAEKADTKGIGLL